MAQKVQTASEFGRSFGTSRDRGITGCLFSRCFPYILMLPIGLRLGVKAWQVKMWMSSRHQLDRKCIREFRHNVVQLGICIQHDTDAVVTLFFTNGPYETI